MASTDWHVVMTTRPRLLAAVGSRQVLFGGYWHRGIFFDPIPAELNGFIGGKPGPVGAARADCDPNSLAVDMLFDREGC